MSLRLIAYFTAASATLLGGTVFLLENRVLSGGANAMTLSVSTLAATPQLPKLVPAPNKAPADARPSSAPTPSPPPYPLQRLVAVPDLERFGLDDQLFGKSGDRWALISSLNQSLRYIRTPQARQTYQKYPVPGFSRLRVERSLKRFRELLIQSKSAAQLQAAVMREFQLYQSVGRDGAGTVGFTGYYVPIQKASRVKTAVYRYPLYKLPSGFRQWSKPHPTRAQLEGKDALQGAKSQLKGQELVYLTDRLQVFLIHVQGSAQLQLTDGTVMSVGYAGATDHPYSSIGKELVKDGKFKLDELTLPKVLDYFQQNPAALDDYLPRNQRFVFFKNTKGSPPLGSLGFPVMADRSIATDKTKMPPGALALIHTQLPDRQLTQQSISRFVLDQDTGSAIQGPGRVDVFLGTGDLAGQRAGLVNGVGQLYYLLLKESPEAALPPLKLR